MIITILIIEGVILIITGIALITHIIHTITKKEVQNVL
jgi:hypothetical protein